MPELAQGEGPERARVRAPGWGIPWPGKERARGLAPGRVRAQEQGPVQVQEQVRVQGPAPELGRAPGRAWAQHRAPEQASQQGRVLVWAVM